MRHAHRVHGRGAQQAGVADAVALGVGDGEVFDEVPAS